MLCLVANPNTVLAFAREVLQLPDEDSKVTHFVSLAARKKYAPTVKVRKGYFRREVISCATPAKYLRTLRLYEVAQGLYVDDVDQPLPPESLSVYTSVNARDFRRSLKTLFDKCADYAFQPTQDFSLVSAAKTAVQKSGCAIKSFVTLDLDVPKEAPAVVAFLAERKIPVAFTVQTRGGFHLLIDLLVLSGEQKRVVYRDVPKTFSRQSVSVDNDMMCPVPGTMQGGHEVTFHAGPPVFQGRA